LTVRLTSMIVDLQRKNQDLEMKVEMMSKAALNGYGDDSNNYHRADQKKPSKKKPHIFCDICDCFHLHNTEDPLYSMHHGSLSEEWPHCEIGEIHSTFICIYFLQKYIHCVFLLIFLLYKKENTYNNHQEVTD
uniref:Uncharacterized protein n=1 Tax=Marmota marmota marmota TaxID=9994 RepID=A0A8C5ZLS9_MARMA